LIHITGVDEDMYQSIKKNITGSRPFLDTTGGEDIYQNTRMSETTIVSKSKIDAPEWVYLESI